jgi:hypothetical protein
MYEHPPSGEESVPQTLGSYETSETAVPTPPGGAGNAPPPGPSAGYPYTAFPMPMPQGPVDQPRLRRVLSSRRSGWVVAGVLLCAVLGLSISLSTTSSAASPAVAGGAAPGRFGFGGGTFGTVDGVSASSFTMTTGAGQELTVDEQSSTTYRSDGTAATGSAVTTGEHVAVTGSTSGSTIKATQVTVFAAGGGGFGGPGSGDSGSSPP